MLPLNLDSPSRAAYKSMAPGEELLVQRVVTLAARRYSLSVSQSCRACCGHPVSPRDFPNYTAPGRGFPASRDFFENYFIFRVYFIFEPRYTSFVAATNQFKRRRMTDDDIRKESSNRDSRRQGNSRSTDGTRLDAGQHEQAWPRYAKRQRDDQII